MFGYDLKQASKYFLQDEHKVLKMFILYILTAIVGVLSIASSFIDKIDKIDIISTKYILIAFVLFIAINCYYSGYLASNVNSRIIKPENKLPRLSGFSKYLIAGFKVGFGLFLYQIIFSLLIGISILLLAGSAGLLTAIPPIGIILMLTGLVVFVAGILMCLMYIITGSIAFCTNLKFSSMFNGKVINNILYKNFKSLGEVVLIVFILGISCLCISILLGITIVGIVLIPAVWLFIYLMIGDLYAQFVRKIFKIGQGEAANG